LSRQKKTPLNFWETALKGKDDKHYSRIGDSLLESPIVWQLNRATFYVLMQMIKACAGKRAFNFSKSYYENLGGLNKSTVTRAVKELKECGFLEIQIKERQTCMEPNVYIWSNKWKEKNTS
jgi:hypothetical protein